MNGFRMMTRSLVFAGTLVLVSVGAGMDFLTALVYAGIVSWIVDGAWK